MKRTSAYKVLLVLLSCSLLTVCGVKVASAAPKVTVKQDKISFTQVLQGITFTVVSSETGTLSYKITDAKGNSVATGSKLSVKAKTPSKIYWAGRATVSSQVGYLSGEYVIAGIYTAQITVKNSKGKTSSTKNITVLNQKKPKITTATLNKSSVTPPATAKTMITLNMKVSVANDIRIRIISRDTKKIVAQFATRDLKAQKVTSKAWNGRTQYAKATKLSDGTWAPKGAVVAAGKYDVEFFSNGAAITKVLTIGKLKPSSAAFPSLSAVRYSDGKKKVALAKPTITPLGAYNSGWDYSASDPSRLTVNSDGTATVLQDKDGKVILTAVSQAYPSIKTTATQTILSSSTLHQEDFEPPYAVLESSTYSIGGKVESNCPLTSVKIAIYDKAGAVVQGYPKEVTSLANTNTTSVDIKKKLDPFVKFGELDAGTYTMKLIATDTKVTRTLSSTPLMIIGMVTDNKKVASFWADRKAAGWVFPLDYVTGYPGTVNAISKLSAGAKFGATRSGGSRNHAAVDLLARGYSAAPHNLKSKPAQGAASKVGVYAMTDGVVTRISASYYDGTGCVEVLNSDGSAVNYAEIKPVAGLKKGSKISRNLKIGTLQWNSAGTSMLHLEVYYGSTTGYYTDSSNKSMYDYVTKLPYQRRRDLLSPSGVVTLPIPKKGTR